MDNIPASAKSTPLPMRCWTTPLIPPYCQLNDISQEFSSSCSDVEEGQGLDRAEELLLSLQVLARMRNLKYEMNRLDIENADPSKAKFECYPFTKDMFSSTVNKNTPAFFAVTHLLFELLDPEGCNERFRTCWPVHEKKQESEYRRAAFQWVEELYVALPEFFVHGKPVFSIFMSPAGDKCLRLIENLVQLTMYGLAQEGQGNENLKRQPFLHKFERSEDPALFQVQLNILDQRWQALLKSTVEIQKSTMMKIVHRDEKIAKNDAYKKEYNEWVRNELEVLIDAALDRPDLFPADAPDIIADRKDYFTALVKKLPPISLLPNIIEDPLAIVINQIWAEKLTEAKEVFEHVHEFCEKHKRLWKILSAYETNCDVVLDANKLRSLSGDDTPKDGNNPSELRDILGGMTRFLKEFREKIEEADELSPEILSRLATQEGRVKFLKDRAQKIRERRVGDVQGEIARTKFQIKAMSLRFDGIEWSRLSKARKFFSESDTFTWTPPKALDFDKHTGLTPNFERLRDFLDDSFNGTEESPELVTTKTVPKMVNGSSPSYSEQTTLEDTTSTGTDTEHQTVIEVEMGSPPIDAVDVTVTDSTISGLDETVIAAGAGLEVEVPLTVVIPPSTPAHSHVTSAPTTARKSKSNTSLDRVLDNLRRLSRSPNSSMNTSTSWSERRKSSLIGRFLPKDKDPEDQANLSISELFGNMSIVEDIDELVCNGIMDESMCDFDFDEDLSFNFDQMSSSEDNIVKNEPVQVEVAQVDENIQDLSTPVALPRENNCNFENNVKTETPVLNNNTKSSSSAEGTFLTPEGHLSALQDLIFGSG